jgi:hypothetical protein
MQNPAEPVLRQGQMHGGVLFASPVEQLQPRYYTPVLATWNIRSKKAQKMRIQLL